MIRDPIHIYHFSPQKVIAQTSYRFRRFYAADTDKQPTGFAVFTRLILNSVPVLTEWKRLAHQ
jgi:hypothetical protein